MLNYYAFEKKLLFIKENMESLR
ncbi:hypothetical protein NITGR_1060014 [Nitrospina gracilis 3/211]|uniref:Uncharacterized protein n=1 Tax=Nitrospina gracilis (strain 3/211) TaxID=1266370 RepID=M1YVZ4_NITG3|nr:hypothetical protein NITGR_1060014 [Nitrospina gracilis 3/211]